MLALSPTRRVQFLAGVAWPSAEVRHAQQYSLTERWRRAVRFTRVAR
jgi:hypothetical protein